MSPRPCRYIIVRAVGPGVSRRSLCRTNRRASVCSPCAGHLRLPTFVDHSPVMPRGTGAPVKKTRPPMTSDLDPDSVTQSWTSPRARTLSALVPVISRLVKNKFRCLVPAPRRCLFRRTTLCHAMLRNPRSDVYQLKDSGNTKPHREGGEYFAATIPRRRHDDHRQRAQFGSDADWVGVDVR